MLFSPLLIHTETLSEGLQVTAVGFGMVFILLVLICLVIMLFSYINRLAENRANAAKAEKAENKPVENKPEYVVPQSIAKTESKAADDLELIAVITAAIAASANVSADKLVIKSLKRVNLRSGWSSQALIDQQNTQY
jgi:sodium pump decarboxylase gamma subunit